MTTRTPKEITVLLVEDMDPPRVLLKRAFEVAGAGEFKFKVYEARSVKEYHEIIRDKKVDVLVVDIGLKGSEHGIDDIVMFHRLHSPDTIIIVYTSFPAMDPIRSCVAAIRAGAVDCINKAEPESARAVLDRALVELRERASPHLGPSSEWLESQLASLIRDYGGRAVAIIGETVVASAGSISELRKELAARPCGGTPFLMVIPRWED